MDVTCTRCGTTYEFEEGLVSTTGTTVKCTTCGHLFKLHRTSDAPPPSETSGAARWRIRRADGSVHTLESLAELTPLIQAGQFRKDDAISRSGKVWKRLGEVAELAALFDAAGPRGRLRSDPPVNVPASMPSERPPAGEPRSVELTGPPSEPPPPPRTRRNSGFETMGVPIDLQSPLPAVPPATRPPTPMRNPLGNAARSAEPARVSMPVAAAPVPPVAINPLPAADAIAAHDLLPDDEPMPLQPPRPRLWVWVLMVSVALAGGAVVLSRQLAVKPPQSEPASPARDALKRADDALASDRTERFAAAITDYEIALAAHPDDPHILSSLSRVYAVWAQALRFATPPGVDEQAQRTLLGDTQRLAEQAKRYGERAAQRNPGNEEASVALSDALRLTSNLVAARAELDRARATEGVPAAETLRVAALLAIDEQHGDLHAGRKLAEQSVAQDPQLIRSRLLLARCLAHEGDREGAQIHLDAVRAIDATHPLIGPLDQAIAGTAGTTGGGGAPAPAGATATSSAGGSAAGGSHAIATAAVKPSTTTPREDATTTPRERPKVDSTRPGPSASASDGKPGDKATDKPSEGKPSDDKTGESKPSEPEDDPAELVRRGENLLERGKPDQAERVFLHAMQLSPGLARAQVGLGYVALERGQPKAAVPLFRAAASSGDAEALIGLGDSFRRLGKLEEALRAYKSYVQRFPRGDKGSIARHQIELLSEQLPVKP